MSKRGKKISFDDQPMLPFEEFEFDEPPRRVLQAADRELSGLDNQSNPVNPVNRHINFISFGSGSSGNSCYLGITEDGKKKGGVIVDAGVKAEDIMDTLHENGVPMSLVHGILLTHDHSDHVKYAYQLLKANRHMRLYCTNRVLNGLLRRHGISRLIKNYHVPIFKEIPFKVAGFEVTAFDVPHDGSDNMGFSLLYDNRNFVLATDMGSVSERARYYISRAHYLVIESNYDLRMLREGKYPEYLKARIQNPGLGHMDNRETSKFLREMLESQGSERVLQYVFLCHLSKDNNNPEIALECVRAGLNDAGLIVGTACNTQADRNADIQLMALPRFEPSRWFVFRPGG